MYNGNENGYEQGNGSSNGQEIRSFMEEKMEAEVIRREAGTDTQGIGENADSFTDVCGGAGAAEDFAEECGSAGAAKDFAEECGSAGAAEDFAEECGSAGAAEDFAEECGSAGAAKDFAEEEDFTNVRGGAGSGRDFTDAEGWREISGEGTDTDKTSRRAARRGNRRFRRAGRCAAAAFALCCVLAGAGGAYALAANSSGASASSALQFGSHTAQATTLSSTVDTSEELTTAELYEKYVGSTVGITTTTTTNYWGYETESAASGSGFILTSDGYILTNYHVIEDSSEITVTTYDDTAYEATLVGYDESNDIAVLKVGATGLTPVVLGDSDNLSVGDDVAAIGNPLGELTFSLTTGIVSAKDRQITMSNGVTMNLIQTDCAINSGNSGGALFNMYGEVVGITNAKYSGSSSGTSASVDNIGFAIPISSVTSIVQSIIEDGTVTKPYIGVSITDVSSEMTGYGLPDGAVVKSVTEDSPAEEAGLQENDIITKVGDTEITSASDLTALVKKASEGDELTLTVYRSGETIEVTVTVDVQTTSALQDTDSSSDSDSSDNSGESSGSNGFGGYWNSDGFGNSDGNGMQSSPWGDQGGYGNGSGNESNMF